MASALFGKPIAPKTPVDADLGGSPGVAATATKPMYSKPRPSKRGGKPASFSKGGGIANFKGGKR
jgi:hypothetical protein